METIQITMAAFSADGTTYEVGGSAAVDAGEDMTGIVDDDIDGQSRPNSVYA